MIVRKNEAIVKPIIENQKKDKSRKNGGEYKNRALLHALVSRKIWNRESGKREADPRQKRYTLEEKAQFIGYMLNREQSEEKSNVTWYAERHGVSRQTLYELKRKFEETFEPKDPGPQIDATEELVKRLQEEMRTREEECQALEEILGDKDQKQKEQRERIIKTILQAAVSPSSVKEIRETIKTAFGINISKRKIKQLIAEYSEKARMLLKSMGAEKLVEFLAIDEVFSGSKPILTGVDLNSFAVVVCEKAGSRDHKVWHQVLNLFPCLKLVTSDRAKGIVKAVYLCGEVRHQFDLFHFKRSMNRTLRQFESKAYKKIEAEYKAQAKIEKSKNDQQWIERKAKYNQLRREALGAIEEFDRMEKATKMIYEGLDIFEKNGRFKAPEKTLKKLERGAQLLEKASSKKQVQKLVKQVKDPRLFLFLIDLREKLLSFVIRWKPGVAAPVSREKVVKIIAEYWYWSNQENIRVSQSKKESRKQWRKRKDKAMAKLYKTQFAHALQLRQLQLRLANYNEVFQSVTIALDQVFRASSLVESFNSHVRVCQQVKKGLHKNFLYLVALKWNMCPFEQGKRKGQSPFQILGIQSESLNWLDLLLAL